MVLLLILGGGYYYFNKSNKNMNINNNQNIEDKNITTKQEQNKLPSEYYFVSFSSRGVIFNLVMNENWNNTYFRSESTDSTTGGGPILYTPSQKILNEGKNVFYIEIVKVDQSKDPMFHFAIEKVKSNEIIDTSQVGDKSIIDINLKGEQLKDGLNLPPFDIYF
jgi:hypothetical protein